VLRVAAGGRSNTCCEGNSAMVRGWRRCPLQGGFSLGPPRRTRDKKAPRFRRGNLAFGGGIAGGGELRLAGVAALHAAVERLEVGGGDLRDAILA